MSGRRDRIEHVFVENVPDVLEDGKLYVSIPYATVVHRCLCGCGHEVVTPLSPTDWRLTFDGETVSLAPSIGNWSFACRSHYWIVQDRIEWSFDWSQEQIDAGRARDAALKRSSFGESVDVRTSQVTPDGLDGGLKSRLRLVLSRARRRRPS